MITIDVGRGARYRSGSCTKYERMKMNAYARILTRSMIALSLGFAGCAGCLGVGESEEEEFRAGVDASVSNEDQRDGGTMISMDAAGGSDFGADADRDPTDVGTDADGVQVDAGNDASFDLGSTSVCGDGLVEGQEVCDDDNTDDGDYCAADCSAITGSCSDGVLQSNEGCDDGQTSDCTGTHDGGDGICYPRGMCAPDYTYLDGRCEPSELDFHVHIHVANDCSMTVDPLEVTIPAGQTVFIDWHNHSQWYEVDVWMSYGGGFLDLARGATWDEPIDHCLNINPYTAYADISTACSQHRFYIRCE